MLPLPFSDGQSLSQAHPDSRGRETDSAFRSEKPHVPRETREQVWGQVWKLYTTDFNFTLKLI